MNLPMDNLNDQEIELFANIANAPQEQQHHFRMALSLLMRCYGENPTGAAVVLYVDRANNTLDVHQLGVNLMEAAGITGHVAQQLRAQLHESIGAAQTDPNPTVQ